MKTWLTSKEFRSIYKVTPQNLYRLTKQNKVKTKEIFGVKYYEGETNEIEKFNVIYCRVSNQKQKDDNERQERLLREYCISNGYKVDKVFIDIASGMNENRKGFNELINLIIERKVNKVFISYKDRLTRFGFNYFEYLFKLFDTEIVVVNLTKEEDFQTELTQDLISIIHHFSMKMYSNRRKELKVLKKSLENDIKEIS